MVKIYDEPQWWRVVMNLNSDALWGTSMEKSYDEPHWWKVMNLWLTSKVKIYDGPLWWRVVMNLNSDALWGTSMEKSYDWPQRWKFMMDLRDNPFKIEYLKYLPILYCRSGIFGCLDTYHDDTKEEKETSHRKAYAIHRLVSCEWRAIRLCIHDFLSIDGYRSAYTRNLKCEIKIKIILTFEWYGL